MKLLKKVLKSSYGLSQSRKRKTSN